MNKYDAELEKASSEMYYAVWYAVRDAECTTAWTASFATEKNASTAASNSALWAAAAGLSKSKQVELILKRIKK